jgi:hypothetical protein
MDLDTLFLLVFRVGNSCGRPWFFLGPAWNGMVVR